ncbi:MAG: L-arabinose ABC transporter permease AraH [Planctomycetota bacterium]
MRRLERLSPAAPLGGLWQNASMLCVFAALFGAASFVVPSFLTAFNMVSLALSVSTVGMVACTMLFCLAAGDFDLSVESVVAFSGVLAAVVINATGSVGAGIAAALLAGALIGLANGCIITKLKINALITTFATMQIVRGLGYLVSGGTAVGINSESFFGLGSSSFLGIPTPVWITLASFALFGLLLNRTVYGRNALAIGGNAEAARLAGVAVDRTKITIFAVQGLMAAFAGLVLASRMTSGQPRASEGFSLDVISACVLGGVSLSGGVGTMLGTVVGVFIMGTVQNGMNLLNIPTFYQYIVRGTILLLAVLLDRLKHR